MAHFDEKVFLTKLYLLSNINPNNQYQLHLPYTSTSHQIIPIYFVLSLASKYWSILSNQSIIISRYIISQSLCCSTLSLHCCASSPMLSLLVIYQSNQSILAWFSTKSQNWSLKSSHIHTLVNILWKILNIQNISKIWKHSKHIKIPKQVKKSKTWLSNYVVSELKHRQGHHQWAPKTLTLSLGQSFRSLSQ